MSAPAPIPYYPRVPVNAPVLVRFEMQYIPEPNSGCWLWIGGTSGGRNPRPLISERRKVYLAHRLALELLVGPIPAGLYACHRCNNVMCVNPEHLYAGTAQQNIDDMMRAGRHWAQGRNPAAMAKISAHARGMAAAKFLNATCVNGHPWSAENTRWEARSGRRRCVECSRKFLKDYRQRRGAA